jgi:hypothetical protein
MAKREDGAGTVRSGPGWQEADFEKWVLGLPDRTLVLPDGSKLLLVRRQEPISRVVDLLFVDEQRRLVLMEVKNERTTRLALGQALEYLGAYHDYDIEDLCEDAGADRDLRAEFKVTYGKTLNVLSTNRHVILVAPGFDVPSSVACTYLGRVLSGVAVSMLAARRQGRRFELKGHVAPPLLRLRTLKSGFALSPSGRRLFYVLQGGSPPVVWWIGRPGRDGQIALPSDKQKSVFRSNRYAIAADSPAGVDVSKLGSVWQRNNDPDKLAYLLGYVSGPRGERAVLVRARAGEPTVVRRVPRKRFEAKWSPSARTMPDWVTLAEEVSPVCRTTAARRGANLGSPTTGR